ncbi:MAG: hypothetical protein AAGD25_15030 [Cyanobacteria bacterium P01_F01_bin.150]
MTRLSNHPRDATRPPMVELTVQLPVSHLQVNGANLSLLGGSDPRVLKEPWDLYPLPSTPSLN